ncbi:MAG TPA: M15 family metallopeptidase [Longimicrobiales bacterium]|nr:M15 family metallopeptidase [Longimicrobiales bacterium]
MRQIIPLLLIVAGCASAQRVQPPPSAPRNFEQYIGEYYAAHDTLYVRENDGRLEAVLKRQPTPITKISRDTFQFGVTRLVLGSNSAQLNGESFTRRVMEKGTFRITPVRPVAQLREEALKATPPKQPDSLLTPDLVELQSLGKTIKYDIRYATTNNFASNVFYSSAHAFMQRPAAEAVVRANEKLKQYGYALLIHDAYRPWYVTKMFWEATPDSLHDFVADPASGSRHNRGAAVDLTLYDLKTGQPIEMTGGYDEFSERSFPNYPGGTTRQRWHRELLRRVMEEEGFRVYDFEWWHFDYNGWRRYPITNLTFEQLLH